MATNPSARRLPPILLLGCLLAPLLAAGAAGEGEEKGKPVAEILGKAVYEADLGSPEERERRFEGMLWTAVFEDYARSRDVRPTGAEVGSLVERMASRARESTARWRQLAETLRRELASPDLGAEREAEIEARLETLDSLIESEAEVAARREALGEAERAAAAGATREVAQQWARRWKVNQALFREFGGRVIFQQAGMEPVDAYRELLERYAERDAFRIHDPALEKAAWRYLGQSFTALTEEEGRFYFEKPPWQRTPEELEAAGFAADD